MEEYVRKTTEGPGYPSLKPINAAASPNARKLLQYFYSLKGTKVLSGNHNWINNPLGGMNTVKNEQGDYPVIQGMEVGRFDPSYTDDQYDSYLQTVVTSSIDAWKSGRIPVITFHQSYPGLSKSWPNVQRANTTNEEFNQIVTPGTTAYIAWKCEVDHVFEYLKQLRDLDVPFVFRPYHEMNGQWFWWGVKENFNKLWDNIYSLVVNEHLMHNVLWMWNPNVPTGYTDATTGVTVFEYNDPRTFPGVDKVDILGMDIYITAGAVSYKQQYHDDLNALAEGKIIAIGENGQLPSPEVLACQKEWSWFMTWPDYWTKEGNMKDTRTATYWDPKVFTAKEVSMSEFSGYKGDEIHYITEDENVAPTLGLPAKPKRAGQITVHKDNVYVAIHSNDQTGWVQLSKSGLPVMSSPSGFRFKGSISDEGILTFDKLTILKDSFNRADNTTSAGYSDTGQKWTPLGGSKWGIAGNKLTSINRYNNDLLIADVGTSDYRYEVTVSSQWNLLDPSKIDTPWNTTYGSAVVFVRASADAANYFAVIIRHGKIALSKKDSTATNSVTVTSSLISTQDSQPFRVSILCKGPQIVVHLDEVEVLRYTLTPEEFNKYSTYNYVGMRYDKSGAPTMSPTWDDVVVEKNE
ncbi:Mannan endo-1,4-beta-mannosidase [compost metagenome]